MQEQETATIPKGLEKFIAEYKNSTNEEIKTLVNETMDRAIQTTALYRSRLLELFESLIKSNEVLDSDTKRNLLEWQKRQTIQNVLRFFATETIRDRSKKEFNTKWEAYLDAIHTLSLEHRKKPFIFHISGFALCVESHFTSEEAAGRMKNQSGQPYRRMAGFDEFKEALKDEAAYTWIPFTLIPPQDEDTEIDWLCPLIADYLHNQAKHEKRIRREADAKAAQRQAARTTPAERRRAAVRVTMANDGITRYPTGGLGLMPEMLAAARMADNGLLSFDEGEDAPLILVPDSRLAIKPQKEQTALVFKDLDSMEHLQAARSTSVFKDVVLSGLKSLNSPYTMDTYATTLLELLIRVDSGHVDGHSVKTPILWKELENRMDLGDLGKDAILDRRRAAFAMYEFILRNPVVFKGDAKGKPYTIVTPIFELAGLVGEGKNNQLFTGIQAAIGETMARGLFGVGAPKKSLECSLLDVTAITHTPFNKSGRTSDLRLTYQLTKTAIDGRTYKALHGKNHSSEQITLTEADIAREILPQPRGTGAAQRVAKQRQREALQKVCAAMVEAGAAKSAQYTPQGEIIAVPCYRMADACSKLAEAHKEARARERAQKTPRNRSAR